MTYYAVRRGGKYLLSPSVGRLSNRVGRWSPSLRLGYWFEDRARAEFAAKRLGAEVVGVELRETPLQ